MVGHYGFVMEFSQVAATTRTDKQRALDPDPAGFELDTRGLQPHNASHLFIIGDIFPLLIPGWIRLDVVLVPPFSTVAVPDVYIRSCVCFVNVYMGNMHTHRRACSTSMHECVCKCVCAISHVCR